MSSVSLRVPHSTPLPSPNPFYQLLGPVASFVGSDEVTNSVSYNGKTYFAYIDGDGNARASIYDHTTHGVVSSGIVVSGLGNDQHATPCLLVRSSDHKIILAISAHNGAHIYVAISTNAEDVSAWGAATDITSSLGSVTADFTYAHLVQLSGETGKIYLFYRNSTGTLAYTTSTDGGATWSAQTSLYVNGTNHSYWVIGTDSTSRIDFVASDGAASASPSEAASLYHFYYTGGSYYKSDGTLISAGPPLGPSNLTKIHDSSNGYVRVPYAVVVGSPLVCVWVAYNTAGAGSNENYWYGVYSGGTWTTNTITDTGTPPSLAQQIEGGIAIDRSSTSNVYLSRYTSGIWQMFLYQTTDSGATWTSTQLSSDPDHNSKPIAPQNAASGLKALWLFGPLGTGNVGYGQQIRGYPNPIGAF